MTSTSYRDGPAFDALLETAATWVLVATLLWGAALVLAALLERASHGRLPALHWVGCPRRARPLLLAVAGLAVVVPGSAHAATGATGATDGPRPGSGTLPVPTRPTDMGTAPSLPRQGTHPAPHPAPRPAAAAGAERDAGVVVRPGDSLWGLASDRLGPGAEVPQVAALVERLHRRNLAVVGPDPDLLRPGQQLRFPATTLPTPPPPTEAP
ncbi:LysM peptidoglycan-binding domain-containing protein [Nocardioides aurantiacus]|uniref:LysM domain-containing protein n=1 Tax=Nocardioides aurantiacus TaxID=86796 RepID=A0A3N2CVG6_9ACTN|nr:LysM domain-containing protein [Nocardioides aurantiacus]ROR91527.1 hypothetical protein EDD33_2397 [Nocardioides aurantiacus]